MPELLRDDPVLVVTVNALPSVNAFALISTAFFVWTLSPVIFTAYDFEVEAIVVSSAS